MFRDNRPQNPTSKLLANPVNTTIKLLPAESDVHQLRPVKLMMIVARLTKEDIAARERKQRPRTADQHATYDAIEEVGDALEALNDALDAHVRVWELR